MVTNAQIEELAATLEGTCLDLSQGCSRIEINEDEITQEQWVMFDDLVYQCPCGWWIEDSETHTNKDGERVCDDCYELEQEEE